MISIWGWVADAILVLLLTATLVMAARLDRALRMVRRDRPVFEALINNLSSATNSVKLGIQALRNEADRAAEQIERRSEDADKLATDLSFLIEAADRAGARLDEARQLSPDPARLREPDTANAPANAPADGSSQAVASALDSARGDHSDDLSEGIRKLAGIAKRRRTRTPGADASLLPTDLAAPKMDERILPLRSQVTR
jgi:hypothetical protein